MRGVFRGPLGSAGGVTRTFGLQRHFTRDEQRERRPFDRAIFRRIARYYRPYRLHWCIVFLCIASVASLSVLPPIAVGLMLDRAIPDKDTTLLGLLAGAMVLLALLTGFLGVLQQSLTARAGQGLLCDLRKQLYSHLQRMSLWFFTSNRSGEVVSRINNDVNAVEHVASGTMVGIASNVATLCATTIAMSSMDWKLTVLAIAIVPAFYFPSRIVGRVRRRLSGETQQSYAELTGFLNERLHVGGTLLTHIYGQQHADAQQFAEHSHRLRTLNVKQAVVGRWLFMILGVFSAMGPALIYWYGGFKVIQGTLTIGTLVAFAALLGLLYRPLVQLASVYVDLQAAVAVFDRIFDYLDRAPDVRDAPNALPLTEFQGDIRLQDVSFTYPANQPLTTGEGDAPGGLPPASRPALNRVSFAIHPGQRVALVGPSGAGKSTLTYLLPRFYDPDRGSITFDGHDLRELTLESIRQQIGMVTQETFLFHADIRENLLYARPEATTETLHAACRAANIHDFITRLPHGYDTVVGERGFRLSGGEKQRLSIARALLKDPRFLILDEATSSLDATSEHLIQTALDELLRGRTSLIIAHRLSTILHADRIIVLDEGRVAASGTHAELMQQGGLYVELYNKQFARVLHDHATR